VPKNRGLKLNKSTLTYIFKSFGFKSASAKAIVAIFVLGVSLGIAYEEMVGVGTWHNFHADTDKINVCFTPPSGCGSLIAQEISKAKKTIFVQAYGFTSKPIIYQLKEAKNRGIKVSIILDGGHLSKNKAIYQELKDAGIEVSSDKMSGIAHNKVMIIDKHKVITGSFNFTKSADTRNAENVVLIDDANIAKQYLPTAEELIKLGSYII
jgi:phospholipase D